MNGVPNKQLEPRPVDSVRVLLARLMWFIVGPFILMMAAYGIVNSGSGWVTGIDLTFFVVVAIMVGCRWVEQRSGAAMTATGEPASWSHFQRYVRGLVSFAAAVWVAANVLGNHLL